MFTSISTYLFKYPNIMILRLEKNTGLFYNLMLPHKALFTCNSLIQDDLKILNPILFFFNSENEINKWDQS